MVAKWIENIEEFERIKNDWDAALLSANTDNPFLLSDFIIIWWKHF